MNTPSLRQPTEVEELLNVRLSRLAAAGGAPATRVLEGQYGISRRGWRIVALLAQHGSLSPSELAVAADLDRPRASRTVGSLVEQGWVRRQCQAHDARRARLTLSEAGRALHDQIFPEIRAINAAILEALDDAQLEALDQALSLLTAQAKVVNEHWAQGVRANRQAGHKRGRPHLLSR